jgi:hypothetical protein
MRDARGGLMGSRTGDQARYNKMQRKKIARRVAMRALRKELLEKAAAAPPPARPA